MQHRGLQHFREQFTRAASPPGWGFHDTSAYPAPALTLIGMRQMMLHHGAYLLVIVGNQLQQVPIRNPRFRLGVFSIDISDLSPNHRNPPRNSFDRSSTVLATQSTGLQLTRTDSLGLGSSIRRRISASVSIRDAPSRHIRGSGVAADLHQLQRFAPEVIKPVPQLYPQMRPGSIAARGSCPSPHGDTLENEIAVCDNHDRRNRNREALHQGRKFSTIDIHDQFIQRSRENGRRHGPGIVETHGRSRTNCCLLAIGVEHRPIKVDSAPEVAIPLAPTPLAHNIWHDRWSGGPQAALKENLGLNQLMGSVRRPSDSTWEIMPVKLLLAGSVPMEESPISPAAFAPGLIDIPMLP